MLRQLLFKYSSQKGFGIIPNKCICTILFSDIIKSTPKTFNRSVFSTLPNTTIHCTNSKKYYSSKNLIKPIEVTESEYLVRIKNDPDVFGEPADADTVVDKGDIEEENYLEEKPLRSQKLSTKQYATVIKELLQKRKVKEAIDYVEIKMIKEDRVQPENYIFNLLIGACGRIGYTKKAFSLYNEMKRRALKITPGTYTALFNACSNSPWPESDGLIRAKHLRNIIIEKMYEPNITNYNAMIKAFGRCGDLLTAFALVDEMAAKKHVIKADTLNFLLQACITDKEAGFRHALLVWRKFIQKGVLPTLFSYNLMLRCIRDCSLGDIEVTKNVINNLLPSTEKILALEDVQTQKMLSIDQKVENSLIINTPNLMAEVPHLGNILSLSEVTKPEHRLLLVGGFKQFLKNMEDHNCKPDIKTFTQLLDNIPSTLAAEIELMQNIKKNKIFIDIDFYNMLIKKRSMRYDYESAKQVLGMMETLHMRPDLITYGVLALGCKTKEDANSLLEEMKKYNYRLNIEILGAMLHQACFHVNFSYVLHLLELCITQEIKPGQKFLDKLEEFKKKCRTIANDESNPLSSSVKFEKGYKVFRMRYKTWREEIQIDDSEKAHPWQQYRQDSNTNTRHYKDKQKNVRFQPMRSSLFRKKSITQKVQK